MNYIMKSFISILLFLLLFGFSGSAQDSTTDDHYKQIEEKYRHIRDSLSLLHPLIPAVSSVVLHYQQLEIIFYNSLITADKIRNNQGELTDLGLRVSYFYSTLQFTYGVSKNSRFNVGLDVNAIAGRVDENESSSPLKVFDTQVRGKKSVRPGSYFLRPAHPVAAIQRRLSLHHTEQYQFPDGYPL